MRIVLLGHAPILGGTTDLFVQIRDFFLQRGHHVQSVFGSDAGPVDPRVNDAVIFKSAATSWRERMRDYVGLIKSFQPEIDYVIAGYHEMDLFRFLDCVRIRHASTLEQHAFADIPFWLSYYSDYIEACTANTPDAVEEVKRYSGKPTFLLPYRMPAIDSSCSEIEIPTYIDAAKPVEVAFVSRLEMFQKRAHWLPKIIRRCEELGASLQWHLYGDGPEGPALQRKLAQAGNVTFHGWTDRATLYRMLPRHDIYFLCSRWEGLPISMVEAMRFGLACVAPDIPAGIHWTLSHGGGWLYEATSPEAAAQALVVAVRDRGVLLEKRREALQLSVELFSPRETEEYYLKLEAGFKDLTFNGKVLDPATAPKMREVRLSGYLTRLAFAVEKSVHSPRWLLDKVTGQK